jgi:hypothetical protein
MTVKELIEEALAELGMKQAGQSVGSSEINTALSVLNTMLDNWNTQKSIVGETPFSTLGLNDTPTLGTGLRAAIIFNLAVDVAPRFSETPSDLVIKKAIDSLADVKRLNVDTTEVAVDPILQAKSSFNILEG